VPIRNCSVPFKPSYTLSQTHLVSLGVIKQPIAHHNIIPIRHQRQMMHSLRCIGFEPPDLSFPPKLLLNLDPDLKHGGRNVDNVNELRAQLNGFASILPVPAAEIQNGQTSTVADGFCHEFVFEFGEGEAVV
jgi:hypothetical protein